MHLSETLLQKTMSQKYNATRNNVAKTQCYKNTMLQKILQNTVL